MGKFYQLSRDMFSWTPKHQSKLEGMITKAFQNWGSHVWIESLRRVPVVTGQLQASGRITFPEGGFEISYSATYARAVETGRRESTGVVTSQPWIQKVPAHIRKTKSGRIHVAAHTKTYLQGRKPVRMPDGQWKVFTPAMVSKGRNFLGGSLESMLTGALSHDKGLQTYMGRWKSG